MFFLDYLSLTAPGISLFVVLTGFAGIWIGSRGTAPPSLILFTLIGIGLASAGASVFNNYHDRDIDRLMKRTSGRPLPAGRVRPDRSLCFGVILSVTALFILLVFSGTAPAFLALLAILIYSLLYTVLLKRRTPFATEIGGISGALPPVIGWTAVQGSVGSEAFLLFAMMLFWQPPHFWSLAMRYRNDYQEASIPSLPLVWGEKRTKARSLVYILALTIVSAVPFFIGMSGRTYLYVSILLGCLYILLALLNLVSGRDINKYIFFYSIIYIPASLFFLTFDLQR